MENCKISKVEVYFQKSSTILAAINFSDITYYVSMSMLPEDHK